MGVDTPLAVLSEQPKPPSHYFKQLFAQVTHPMGPLPPPPRRTPLLAQVDRPAHLTPYICHLVSHSYR